MRSATCSSSIRAVANTDPAAVASRPADTRDYLEGKRARYMPPFRMYLVLSLIFFVIAFFDPRDDF